MSESVLLIGDIGGTHARFALAQASGEGYRAELTLRCADYTTLEAAIRFYLQEAGANAPAAMCLAVAGPVVHQRVRMTNSVWQFAAADLAAAFGGPAVRLLNDFEAVAHALPQCNAKHCDEVGEVRRHDLTQGDFNLCVVGPGTGLGASGLVRRGDATIALVTEAGHEGFAPESELQGELLSVLRHRYPRVSNERLVSGPGIENIYWALGQVHGQEVTPLGASETIALARSGSDPLARQTVDLFFEILGQVAGDLVLAQGAYDGVYIAGGVAQRHADLLQVSAFRRGFERKGRHRSLLERVPAMLIRHEQPGLLGAAAVAAEVKG